jgi:LuxR family quorum sensing-dependent transcriptional regulator
VARGKTDWEIGEILNISRETSYAHVKSSCRKLDAVTRTQAVVRAMQLGEIAL